MVKASWKGTVIAESDDTVEVEGNHYFPPDAVRRELLTDSGTTSVCGWKGEARYYHVVVGAEQNTDAAWYYPEPKDAAKNIANHVAFWKGVEITD